MQLDQVSWVIGCASMASSLAFSAIAHHSKKMDEVVRVGLHRAVTVHQLSAIGFLILSFAYKETPPLPFALLSAATMLFPGVIYYQSLSNTKSIFSKFVPMGGMMHMAFLALLCVY